MASRRMDREMNGSRSARGEFSAKNRDEHEGAPRVRMNSMKRSDKQAYGVIKERKSMKSMDNASNRRLYIKNGETITDVYNRAFKNNKLDPMKKRGK